MNFLVLDRTRFMTKARLEDLPNELLTDVFKNLNAHDLFRAFSQLNNRFDRLIRSFSYLQLMLHLETSNMIKTNDEIFPFYVHTLVVDPWINFNLHQYPNVRCLSLNSPLPQVLEQLKPEIMPHLERLSVSYVFNMYEIVLLHDKIFSNRFLHLKSCHLFEQETLMTMQQWTSAPSIRVLKTKLIDANVFTTILSACPNLLVLKFNLSPFSDTPTASQCHSTLKRMIVEMQADDWLDDDSSLHGFLACVPNLEQLDIHRKTSWQPVKDRSTNYDWFASMIAVHLPRLRRLHVCLHLNREDSAADAALLDTMQRNFVDRHQHAYQARLDFEPDEL